MKLLRWRGLFQCGEAETEITTCVILDIAKKSKITLATLSRWFKFFLVGVIETAKSGIATFDNILKLQKQVDTQIQTLGSRASNARKVLLYLYQRPLVDTAKVGEVADISSASAYKLIAGLEQLGILREITGGKRGKHYLFEQYLNLFK